MADGQRIAGTARIPVAEMAKDNLQHIFPHLTPEQIEAMKAGKPVPPSPDWQGSTTAPVSSGAACEIPRRQEPEAAQVDLTGLPAPVIAENEHLPLVTCILVFGIRERLRMARKAVNQFVRQHYPRKQLVIVNTTDLDVTNRPHPAIKERKVFTGQKLPTGQMRNQGMDLADGDWIVPCWDDDDYYDPWRLVYQMCLRRPGHAVLLTNQIRVHIDSTTAFMHHQAEGIPNTMLVPNLPETRFDEEAQIGEDLAFWMKHYGVKTVIANNVEFPLNHLSMAAYHGHNITPVGEFMRGYHGPEHQGHIYLPPEEIDNLRTILSDFGVQLSTTPPGEASGDQGPAGSPEPAETSEVAILS